MWKGLRHVWVKFCNRSLPATVPKNVLVAPGYKWNDWIWLRRRVFALVWQERHNKTRLEYILCNHNKYLFPIFSALFQQQKEHEGFLRALLCLSSTSQLLMGKENTLGAEGTLFFFGGGLKSTYLFAKTNGIISPICYIEAWPNSVCSTNKQMMFLTLTWLMIDLALPKCSTCPASICRLLPFAFHSVIYGPLWRAGGGMSNVNLIQVLFYLQFCVVYCSKT